MSIIEYKTPITKTINEFPKGEDGTPVYAEICIQAFPMPTGKILVDLKMYFDETQEFDRVAKQFFFDFVWPIYEKHLTAMGDELYLINIALRKAIEQQEREEAKEKEDNK
jgi:hypothetical protein